MVKHTLVAYDGSESARRAFRFAIDLARCSGSRVRVVNVLQVTESGGESVAMMMTDSCDRRTAELQAELAGMVPDAGDFIDVEIVYGSPGDVLLAQVRKHDIDHIAIGHTERGALGRWLLGSVADDILEHAHVPVTVVR